MNSESDIPRCSELRARLDARIAGQEQAKCALIAAITWHARRIRRNQRQSHLAKPNVICIGASGVGKTTLVETLAAATGLVFLAVDMGPFTSAGYTGAQIQTILENLFAAAHGDVAAAEHAIIFLDEFDKKSAQRTWDKDVSGLALQQELVKLVEGAEYVLNNGQTISTRNILFVIGGVFPGVYQRVLRRPGTTHDSDKDADQLSRILMNLDGVDTEAGHAWNQVTPYDIQQCGFLPELIGRFPVCALFHPLTEFHLYQILKGPASPLAELQAEFKADNVILEFTDNALWAWATQARDQNLSGARALTSVLFRRLSDVLMLVDDIPAGSEGVVQITPGILEGREPVQLAIRPASRQPSLRTPSEILGYSRDKPAKPRQPRSNPPANTPSPEPRPAPTPAPIPGATADVRLSHYLRTDWPSVFHWFSTLVSTWKFPWQTGLVLLAAFSIGYVLLRQRTPAPEYAPAPQGAVPMPAAEAVLPPVSRASPASNEVQKPDEQVSTQRISSPEEDKKAYFRRVIKESYLELDDAAERDDLDKAFSREVTDIDITTIGFPDGQYLTCGDMAFLLEYDIYAHTRHIKSKTSILHYAQGSRTILVTTIRIIKIAFCNQEDLTYHRVHHRIYTIVSKDIWEPRSDEGSSLANDPDNWRRTSSQVRSFKHTLDGKRLENPFSYAINSALAKHPDAPVNRDTTP